MRAMLGLFAVTVAASLVSSFEERQHDALAALEAAHVWDSLVAPHSLDARSVPELSAQLVIARRDVADLLSAPEHFELAGTRRPDVEAMARPLLDPIFRGHYALECRDNVCRVAGIAGEPIDDDWQDLTRFSPAALRMLGGSTVGATWHWIEMRLPSTAFDGPVPTDAAVLRTKVAALEAMREQHRWDVRARWSAAPRTPELERIVRPVLDRAGAGDAYELECRGLVCRLVGAVDHPAVTHALAVRTDLPWAVGMVCVESGTVYLALKTRGDRLERDAIAALR